MFYLLSNGMILTENDIEFINGEDWRLVQDGNYFFTEMAKDYFGVFQRKEDTKSYYYNTLITKCNSINELPHSDNIFDILPEDSLVCYTSDLLDDYVKLYKTWDNSCIERYKKLGYNEFWKQCKVQEVFFPFVVDNKRAYISIYQRPKNLEFKERGLLNGKNFRNKII